MLPQQPKKMLATGIASRYHPASGRWGEIPPPLSMNSVVKARSAGRDLMSDYEGGGILKWVIFLLIFGVGNVILYYTTGWVIIPK